MFSTIDYYWKLKKHWALSPSDYQVWTKHITVFNLNFRYRIGPFEVESCLLEHPAVAESAVVASPDELRGEVVKAFIVLAEEYKHQQASILIAELQDHVKRTTAPYKYPRKVMQSFTSLITILPQ